MGSLEKNICTLLLALTIYNTCAASRGRIYKESDPASIALPLNDETVLTCEMNLTPDRFEWRFFPLKKTEASNPNTILDLDKATFVDLPQSLSYKTNNKSTLTVKMTNYSMAGDYQCLAHYGASVIASIPDRITITTLQDFPQQNNTYVTVVAGNTVVWRCEAPYSNPPAYIDYSRDVEYIRQDSQVHTTSLILSNVTRENSGMYKCKATNPLQQKKIESSSGLQLRVVNSALYEAPKFVIQPKTNYTAKRGDKIFLECSAVGNPPPKITWIKQNGEIQANKTKMIPGGLQISDIQSSDEGVYICKLTNSVATISHSIILIYNEPPKITEGPKSMHIKEGESYELECKVEGIPSPKISWLLNGRSVLKDKEIESVGNQIYFSPIEKRHAGIIQCFATNAIGMTYSSMDLNVIPKQISSADAGDETSITHATSANHKRKKHKNKHKHKDNTDMIPPSKPNISRLNDESVMVRWSVPNNNIQFFKVQYRELGPSNNEDSYGRRTSSRWQTTNAEIPPNIRSFEVNNLKPDHTYKFRIAAVYKNDDNKLSPKSDKFHLLREDFNTKNPLPIPHLTYTETLNTTSIRIFWEYTANPNVTVDGFFINYMPASSAGEYTKETVDGDKTKSFVITHLQQDAVYDIKIQSFNTKSASEFSRIMKQKTEKVTTEAPKVTTTIKPKGAAEEQDSNTYIFIGAGVISMALLLSVIVFFIICRKWKQNKDDGSTRGDDRDKATVEEVNHHHIQAENNDYIVNQKSRNNGCTIPCNLPSNRITITPNPLADADNKSQNMIEMSCLSSQTNNNTASTASATQQHSAAEQPVGKHYENKRRKQQQKLEPPGENYV